MWYTSIHHELTSLSFKTDATSGGTPSQNICKNSTFSLWEPPTISPNQIPWCLSSAAKLAIGINAANFKVLHPCVFGVKWSKSSKIQIRWNYQNHREKGFLSGMNFFETSYIPSNIDSSSKSPHEIINCGRFPLWNIWKIPEFHFSVQPYLLCWSCKGNLKKYTICGSRNPWPSMVPKMMVLHQLVVKTLIKSAGKPANLSHHFQLVQKVDTTLMATRKSRLANHLSWMDGAGVTWHKNDRFQLPSPQLVDSWISGCHQQYH